ncbi:APC family permease [Nesterenkonia suensis]
MSTTPTRKIGLWAAIATAVGIVVSSSAMVSLGEGFGLGGRGFIIAMVAAFALNLCVAFSFAELSGMIPRAGGLNRYTAPALGSTVSMIAVISGYVLVTLFAGSAEAGIAGLVVTDVFGLGADPLLISLLFVAALVVVNIFSVKVYGGVQIVLATALILSIAVLGVIGLTGLGAGEPVTTELPINPLGVGVLSLTALAFWLFIGVEFITPLAEELRRPRLYLPLAMILGLVVIFAADILFGFGALNYLLPEQLAGSPNPHLLAAEALAGPVGVLWMGIMTFLATASTLNTLMIAIPRMLAAQAEEGEMPSILARRNRFGAPWVAVLVLGVMFVLFLITGFTDGESIITFILASVFCWVLAYIIAHLNVIVLRIRHPHADRPFRSPLGLTFQVVGILGMVFVMANISGDAEQAAEIYTTVLILLGITAIYSVVWVKFVMKKGIFEVTPLEEIRTPTGTSPGSSGSTQESSSAP